MNPTEADFRYACLPSAGSKCALEPGELISTANCLPADLNQYIEDLVLEGDAGNCPPTNPIPDKLYQTACGILGDDKHGAPEGGNFRNKYEKDLPMSWAEFFYSPCAALAAVQKENG